MSSDSSEKKKSLARIQTKEKAPLHQSVFQRMEKCPSVCIGAKVFNEEHVLAASGKLRRRGFVSKLIHLISKEISL